MKNLLIIALIVLAVYFFRNYLRGGRVNNENFKDISVAEAVELCEKNKSSDKFMIIDVRSPAEFSGGHIDGAVNINFFSPSFRTNIDKVDKEKKIFIYCLSGGRSSSAMSVMDRLGFKEVYNLSGGISDWSSKGCKIVK